jgi:HEPN domain-containing protein
LARPGTQKLDPSAAHDSRRVSGRSLFRCSPQGYFLITFGAQQAAEKSLKALCIDRGIDFPYVHDLAQLITLLQEDGQTVPDDVKEAGRLTRYAVFTRYPGLDDPVTEEDHERAVAIAERVVAWVEAHLEAGEDASNSRSD